MVEKCWREQRGKGETKNQQAKIGKVFLIDRGETQPRFLPCAVLHFILLNVSSQMWISSLLCAHKWFMKDL